MASPPASRIPWRRSLRVRLVAYFVAVSVATVAAVGVLAYARASADLTNSVYDRLEAVSTLKADSLGRWLDEQRRNVVFVGSIPAVRDLSAQVVSGTAGAPGSDAARATQEALREELDLLVTGTSDATAINVIDLDGNIVVSTTPMFQNRNVAAEPYFVRGKSKTSVQNVYTSGLDARPTITVSTPLLDPDRRRIGVLAANLDIGRLDRIMDERSGLGGTGETYLVDAGHRFVGNGARDAAGGTDTAVSQGIDAAIAGNAGRGSYVNYRDEPVLGVYRWLPDQEVGLIAELGQSEALAPAQDLAISTAVFGLISAGLLAVLIWFIARQVTRPISQLTATAAAVAAGDLDARSGVSGSDEVGVLAASFDSMTIQLQESLTTLERRVEERTADLTAALEAKGEAEKRYRELVEQVPAVTYVDVTGVGSTYVSPQIERMFGVTQEAYTSDPGLWASLLHPEDRERIEATYEEFLDGTGPDLPDYRIVRPDGRIVWVRDRAVTTRDDDGHVLGEHGVMFDVTELKETEAAMAAQAAELARALEAQAETERRYRQLVELLPLMMYVDQPGSDQQRRVREPPGGGDVRVPAGALDGARVLSQPSSTRTTASGSPRGVGSDRGTRGRALVAAVPVAHGGRPLPLGARRGRPGPRGRRGGRLHPGLHPGHHRPRPRRGGGPPPEAVLRGARRDQPRRDRDDGPPAPGVRLEPGGRAAVRLLRPTRPSAGTSTT